MMSDAPAALSDAARAEVSRSKLPHHHLSEEDFDALASGIADDGVIDRLSKAETSYRRMILRAVLDLLRQEPTACGPLESPDFAWDLLVAAERQAPAETASLIACPQVGAWAARMVRRLNGDLHDDTPLWVDAGQLQAVAASAAIQAGIRAIVSVPVRRGVVQLPALGHALLPTDKPWDFARVHVPGHAASAAAVAVSPGWSELASSGSLARIVGRHGSVTVQAPGDPDPRTALGEGRWRPRVSLTSISRGETLAIGLEDADPYRLVGRTTVPARLKPSDVDRWATALHSVWSLLVDGHPRAARELSALTATLAPLPKAAPFRPHSGSTGDAFGGAMLSEPEDPSQFASTLVHELAHFKLGAVLHLFDLTDLSWSRLGYAPWRDDPRPVRGILHGIYAFFHVTEFWRRQRALVSAGEAMLAHFEFAFWRDQTLRTARQLRASGGLTNLGRRFLDGVLVTLEPWCSEPVPFVAFDLARLMARDHQALWRAHHLQAPTALVAELARAWCDDRAAPHGAVEAAGPGMLVPQLDVRDLDGRACLARLWLVDRDRFRKVARADPDREVAGTTPGDCALVSGDRATARQLYLAELATRPERISSWVGLGLTGGSYDVLAMRPELALAVNSAIMISSGRRPELSALAAWLAPAVRTDHEADDSRHEVDAPPGSTEPGGGWYVAS